jgi:hypothetical protein
LLFLADKMLSLCTMRIRACWAEALGRDCLKSHCPKPLHFLYIYRNISSDEDWYRPLKNLPCLQYGRLVPQLRQLS